MSQLILDLSSGNTCLNDKTIVKQMIDAIKDIDTGKHEIILKWQLALDDGINIPLDHDVFGFAYEYAERLGYKTTSSVADLESLKFLLQYDVPFVKIPNDRKLDWLAGYIPRGMKIYISYGTCEEYFKVRMGEIGYNMMPLACISKYPATIEEYDKEFYWQLIALSGIENGVCISDHTAGLDLYKKYKPAIWEKHFVLEHDSNNLDGGLFAITPSMLQEVL
jgi:sialic acid synthase SpsE